MTSPDKEEADGPARAVVLADNRYENGGPEQTPCKLKKAKQLEVDRGIGLELHLHVGVRGKAGLTVLQMVAVLQYDHRALVVVEGTELLLHVGVREIHRWS